MVDEITERARSTDQQDHEGVLLNRGNAEAQHAISARLYTLEDELAVEVGRTTRNIQREKSRDIERYFGEDEQAGHRKHA